MTPREHVLRHEIEGMMCSFEGRVMDESGHQQFLFRLLKKEAHFNPLLHRVHSVPNGGGKLPASTAGRLIGEGLKAGVFDINLDVARHGYHGLKVEMKRPHTPGVKGMSYAIQGGKPSAEQLDWQIFYREQGYKAEICYGWLEAYNEIMGYLRA